MKTLGNFFIWATSVIGSVFLLLILGHCLIGWVDKISLSRVREKQAQSSAFQGNLRKIFKEMDQIGFEYHPYYHWRRKPFSGKYVNVDEAGNRRTSNAANPKAKKVFVFGGSNVWGTGVSDGETIPSYLAKSLGKDFNVTNFGESAFVSTQDLNLFLEQLAFGNIPDIAIFYGGFNDTYAGVYSPAVPRTIQWVESSEFLGRLIQITNYSILLNYLKKKWDTPQEKDLEKGVAKSLHAYLSMVKQVKAIAKAYGFPAYFFWQPSLFSLRRKLTPNEQGILDRESPLLVRAHRLKNEGLSLALKEKEADIISLLDIFDSVPEPVYMDFCHLTPSGNERVAKAIVQSLRPSHLQRSSLQ
jgi:lysophospholipase L1-like esterase